MSVKHEKTPPFRLKVPAGTELNSGTHEDGECFRVCDDIEVLVTGHSINNALPVRVYENGEPVGGTLFFHQPEPK